MTAGVLRTFVSMVVAVAPWAACSPTKSHEPGDQPDPSTTIPPSGVIGVQDAMLSPEFWIARATSPDRVLLPPDQIASRNRVTASTDPAMTDLQRLPATLTRDMIQHWIEQAANPAVSAATIAAFRDNAGIANIPATEPTRYGMAVRRALLHTEPTAQHVYASQDSTDFDQLAAGVLFPGDPVILVHPSADQAWWLVVSDQGPSWVAREDVAEGPADVVFGYAHAQPFRVVTADETRTVFTPEAPEVSELQLDMGVRVPIASVPAAQPINGQGPFESWVIQLPTRGADGILHFKPALLPKVRETAPGYLPLTRANIIRQAFKFLGERYGWGHAYNARDCSGFTSDVYRSMGIVLPPNSGAQGKSPAFVHRLFTAADSHAARLQAIESADVGDLIVVPGHVQMILGHVAGQPYVIQDVPFVIYPDGSGAIHWTKVNQVSVTPLLPLLADGHRSYVDLMTSLVHVTAAR